MHCAAALDQDRKHSIYFANLATQLFSFRLPPCNNDKFNFFHQLIKFSPGLSFDFLGYNMLGWICYSVFNFSLLWVTPVKNQYFEAYPHGVINVQLSDFCFSFHALIITGNFFKGVYYCFEIRNVTILEDRPLSGNVH